MFVNVSTALPSVETRVRKLGAVAYLPAVCLLGLFAVASHADLKDSLTEIEAKPAAGFDDADWINSPTSDASFLQTKVVLVNFWATWCPPCLLELPSIQKAWESFDREDFEVVAVNVGESSEDIDKFLKTFATKLEFSIALDTKLNIYKDWQVRPVPTTFLVDRQNRLRYRALGERDFNSDSIRSIIQSLIDE